MAHARRHLADIVEETEDAIKVPGFHRGARKTRRLAWLKRKAAYLKVQSIEIATQSHDIACRRPFGQPILVGHHSEKSHRRDLERQHAKDRNAYALWQKAKEAQAAATACERNDAIYSDDPEAVDLLRQKVAQLEDRRDRLKGLNAQYRKAKGDIEKMPISPGLKLSLHSLKGDYYLGPDKWRPAYAYTFTNLGANIRRLKQRIKELAARDTQTERPDRHIGDIVIRDNLDFHKVELHFPGKPSDEIRTRLKQYGFRWVRSAGCWSRGINGQTEARLQWLADLIRQPIT